MKYLIKYYVISLSLVVSGSIGYLSQLESENRSQDDLFTPAESRRSITFIMGTDKTDVPYYSNAREYFALHKEEKTDLVINSCRTLECVINYLNNSEERGQLPWSVVNVVAHGNAKTGLNLYIFDEGPKATPKRLVQTSLTNRLPQIDEAVVDSISNINFWSCGIGKNPLINLSLKKIFKPENGKSSVVYCSPHFVIFHRDNLGRVHRLKASYWPYYYKRGYRPSLSEIEVSLRKKYEQAKIDWSTGLRSDNLQKGVFHQSYHIPVSYIRVYKEKSDRPDLSTEENKEEWIYNQPSLVDRIEETGIPFDKFTWHVNKIVHTTVEGEKVFAVKAIGMTTVLNVLRIDEAME